MCSGKNIYFCDRMWCDGGSLQKRNSLYKIIILYRLFLFCKLPPSHHIRSQKYIFFPEHIRHGHKSFSFFPPEYIHFVIHNCTTTVLYKNRSKSPKIAYFYMGGRMQILRFFKYFDRGHHLAKSPPRPRSYTHRQLFNNNFAVFISLFKIFKKREHQ